MKYDFFMNDADDDNEIITTMMPVVIPDEGTSTSYEIDLSKLPISLPVLPLRDMLMFPGVTIPVMIAREKSKKLIDYLDDVENKHIMVVVQKEAETEEPNFEDLVTTGTIAEVVRVIEVNDELMTVILQGKVRAELLSLLAKEPFLSGIYEVKPEEQPSPSDMEYKALTSMIKETIIKQMMLLGEAPKPFISSVMKMTREESIVNFACVYLSQAIEGKIAFLMMDSLKQRAYQIQKLANQAVTMAELRHEINMRTKNDMDKQQKEYFLQQQMRIIKEELSGNEEGDFIELEEKSKKKKWSKEVNAVFEKELSKLQRMMPQSPDYSIQVQYLETFLELPWDEKTSDNFNLNNAQRVLDRDHFGLDKVKERIIEHLAVLKLKGDMRSPIICLYGPPGVGKTSLGKSIADALNRKYVRISLGGLHDEAEIRGHRRTYIGAMPGRIIKGFIKAGSSNPVFVLDEIDKLASDYKGDPSSALLEVLDPEQNSTFHDNYLDVDYDLSKALFIATANNIGDIPAPLRDRMEMIEVSGYIQEEKMEIGARHLLPKELDNHGLDKSHVRIGRRTIGAIIENYTRESGVRQLEKKIAAVLRKVAYKVAVEMDSKEGALTLPLTVSPKDLKEYLGSPIFISEQYEGNKHAGVVTGLAWTSVGGEILLIESAISPAKNGKMTITGNLGDVMKESAILALEYIKSHAAQYDIPVELFDQWNVHIHVPEGAIPKDGPSAGITLVTSLISTFTQRKVNKNIAMTGEITLRGKVLPVGGIKEKILAAKRYGIKSIILCEENRKDIEEIKEDYISGLEFFYVSDIKEVIELALSDRKVDNPIDLTIKVNQSTSEK